MSHSTKRERAAHRKSLLLLTFVISATLQTERAGGSETAPEYVEPLGIALESWPYPYPVHFLPLITNGEAVRMAYMDVPPIGAANGHVALLMHGKNFDSSYWSKTISALSAAGWRVIVPDQVGFNKSSKPQIDYSFDLLAADTAQLLDTLDVADVDVIGHSTGGMLAVRFARTYPQRVRRLVLEDPIGLEDYRLKIPPQTIETLIAAERRTTAASYRVFIKKYFPLLPADRYEPFVAWRMRVALSGEFERFAYATAATYEMIYRQPVRHEYPLLVPPVLLIVGAADRTVVLRQYGDPATVATMGDFPALAKKACDEIPRCELTVVPRVGHVPHLEVPEYFNKRVLDFLRTIP